MGFLPTKSTNKKVQGAELIVTWGVLILSKFFLGFVAPVIIGGYGLYRLFIKKSYPDGIISLAVGVLLYFILNTFSILLWMPTILGIIVLIYGAFLLFLPSKKLEED